MQPVHQLLHDRRVVVDALEEHRLAAERDARVGQHAEAPSPPPGVSSSGWLKCVLIQSGWYLLSISHSSGVIRSGRWHGTRLPIRMISRCGIGAQPGQDGVEPPVVEQQRVAARHDHVPDLGVLLEVLEGDLELRHRDLLGIAHLPPPGAEAAVGRAHRGDQEQRPVRIAVRDVRAPGCPRPRSSESTMPSTTSSSSTVGTYCRQIGSSGDLIKSTIAGEIRNSKLSAAMRSRSSSGKFSGRTWSRAPRARRSSSCAGPPARSPCGIRPP